MSKWWWPPDLHLSPAALVPILQSEPPKTPYLSMLLKKSKAVVHGVLLNHVRHYGSKGYSSHHPPGSVVVPAYSAVLIERRVTCLRWPRSASPLYAFAVRWTGLCSGGAEVSCNQGYKKWQCLVSDSRFEAHEFSEGLWGIVSSPFLSFTLLFGPSHVDLLSWTVHRLFLLIWVQTSHPDQRVSVFNQLGLKKTRKTRWFGWQLSMWKKQRDYQRTENKPLFSSLHLTASSASTSGTSAPSLMYARRCRLRCHCHAEIQMEKQKHNLVGLSFH